MITEIQINLSPTRFDLDKVEEWLIEEERDCNEGFYCNWTTIENAFENSQFITLDFKGAPIGFLVWSKGEIYAEINILEIKPEYRKNGIGQYFFERTSDFFKQNGFLIIKLFCSPRESEKFWKKMGFIKFPDRQNSESDLTYFKPLVEILPTSENESTDNKIELWNVEPYQVNNYQPKWTWNVKLNNDKLVLPIIQPCNCNWNLKLTKNGKTINEGKVKHLDSESYRLDYSPFLYIDKLIE